MNVDVVDRKDGGIAPYVTNHGAVTNMNRVLVRVDTDEGISGWGEMRVFLSPEVTVTILEDGIAPIVVGNSPYVVEFYVDHRLTIGEDEATAHAELEDAVDVARESCGDAVDATVETLTFDAPSYTGYRKETPKYYPTWVLDADHPLVAETKRIVDEMLGGDAEIGRWTFSTSGTYTIGVAGIPTVGFEPSQESYAHTTWDQVEVDDVVDAAAVYAALGLEL